MIIVEDILQSYLVYVLPFENVTSGQSHDNENVIVRVDPDGTITEAATAAPIQDDRFDGADVSGQFRLSKDPC